jgi:DnaJ-class molecular chaperone
MTAAKLTEGQIETPQTCYLCIGQGVVMRLHEIGGCNFLSYPQCHVCNGAGKINAPSGIEARRAGEGG